ncbi:HD domain-containing phosphohydrolase [Tindallia californiensis]|uniref:Stage 0 sporulation protein A homolog n=1 Tax=Tindallia californiensis TaxID=159292 RepID=A0A1H3KG68_9FIRM|nr:HD domain-containing phosphohydrolase [Tindallia californiensis]SDY51030.1 putative two-component system response regulator [Tindallia californiensis]
MKVLIAEDNRIARMTLVSFIKQMDYEPIEAEDGLKAIRLWEKEQPSIVLTDWLMPNKSGTEVTRHIRDSESNAYTYIIMITSKGDQTDLEQGFRIGVDDYLTKPVNKQELLLRMKAGERLLNLQSKDTLIFGLAKLAGLRDKETGDHLERIRIYSKILAEVLAEQEDFCQVINRRFIESIYDTSPLHDVGKVGIQDRILLKNGKLTEEEFEEMKQHTVIGQRTLLSVQENGSNSKHIQMTVSMAAEIAGSHHEKWDGSGYPLGLKGEDIPLAARIVSLADVYDALRSIRVYKEERSHEEAKAVIIKETGKHFDPRVVRAFLESEEKFFRLSNLPEKE